MQKIINIKNRHIVIFIMGLFLFECIIIGTTELFKAKKSYIFPLVTDTSQDFRFLPLYNKREIRRPIMSNKYDKNYKWREGDIEL